MSSHLEPFGIAVLDIYEGRWAIWQVSSGTSMGSLRASATNAVITVGYDEKVFRSLTYRRPLLMTARAQRNCSQPEVLASDTFNPEKFFADCRSWIDVLQDLFWAENDRRQSYNKQKLQERKEARKSGSVVPDYRRQAPLIDIDWPAPPSHESWSSQVDCELPVNSEALRVANGCIRVLNYWLEIEADRTRKTRKYFKGYGGPEIRRWPAPLNPETLVDVVTHEEVLELSGERA